MRENVNNVTTYEGVARILCDTLETLDCDSDALLKQVGISLARNPGNRIRTVLMQKMWQAALEETGREDLGLCFAEHIKPVALHGLGFAWMASETLLDAFERLVRYYRIIITSGGVSLIENGRELKVLFKSPIDHSKLVPASMDATLAVFVQLCRMAKGGTFSPTEVRYQRQKVKKRRRFDEFFGCPVKFHCEENSLLFNRKELESVLPLGNAELARGNDRIVVDYLKRHDSGLVSKLVRTSIIERLPSGQPSQEATASDLNLSVRTLQRKLSAENVTYKKLVDEVRLELAEQYLKEYDRSISEVTYLLGFSEPSNFARAFKRWTASTPQDYQEQYAAPVSTI